MLGRPCKIVDMSTSKTGKHGHAKVHLVAIDVSTLSGPDTYLSHDQPDLYWQEIGKFWGILRILLSFFPLM